MENFIDKLSKLVSLVSLVIAAVAAWYALPMDKKVKALDAETRRLENARIAQDLELKTLETSRQLSLQLYTEVKDVLRSKDHSVKEEEAVRVLVDALADDPFRWKLLQALAVGASDPEVKEKAEITANFFKDEEQIPTAANKLTAQMIAPSEKSYNAIRIDWFYCDGEHEEKVRAALKLKTEKVVGRWRPRLLPNEINSRPGYNVHSNIIRFNSDERTAAEALQSDLRERLSMAVSLQEIQYPTANYISVFFCGD
ncbi:MAG TPA: hypothetical protein VN030_06370 [Cellvibrio sp.]|nr:hypothetical protein [Cellvibrio sp.]